MKCEKRNGHARLLLGVGIATATGCQGPTAVTGPMLVVEGGGVYLPEVPEGETAYTFLTLRNAGNGPLLLHATDLVAAPAWGSVGWPAMPLLLSPDARLALRLEYAPARGSADGAVWIDSDDDARPRLRVPLDGLDPLPTVEASQPEVSFDPIQPGGAANATVRIANGGDGTLGIRRVSLSPETSADFSLEAEVVDALAPGEWMEATITYRPTGGGADHGALLVETDDPADPLLVVPLSGEQRLPTVY